MRRQGISSANPARTRRIRPAAPKRRPTTRLCRVAATLTAGLLAATPLAAHAQQADRVTDVAIGDLEMNAAKAKARAELPVFFAHASAPGPGESYFLIKYDVTPELKAEFVWAEVIAHRGDVTVARLVNRPRDSRFAKGQQVTVRNAQIVDWGYLRDGVMQGNYTTRVVLRRLPPAEAARLRAGYGW